MPLARFDRPFEHPDWIFEPKMDGFRAVAYVERGACRLVSRNHNAFKTFDSLAQAIGQELSGRVAILDGEIVRPGPDGRPLCGRKEFDATSWPRSVRAIIVEPSCLQLSRLRIAVARSSFRRCWSCRSRSCCLR